MIKKILFLGLFSIVVIGFAGYSQFGDILLNNFSTLPKIYISDSDSIEIPEKSESLQTDYTAQFEIFTNGTQRIFSDSKYHNQSTDVFIKEADPHVIFLKKSKTTWNDFFSTLPFSLQKDCLVTGTKQTFCNSKTSRLYFYLNEQDTPDALEMIIAPNDSLRVEYKVIGVNN